MRLPDLQLKHLLARKNIYEQVAGIQRGAKIVEGKQWVGFLSFPPAHTPRRQIFEQCYLPIEFHSCPKIKYAYGR